jgi:thioredoxin-like negative regulator of GroEL
MYLKRLDGKVNLGKVNCDNHRQICERASIRAYPTIKYYKGSHDSKRQVNFE